jgi:hypothetical protein
MTVIGELVLDLADSDQEVVAKLFAPEQATGRNEWTCRFEIGEPFDYAMGIHGETSMQALALALSALSVTLYCSEEYESGKLGIFGEFGGYLSIPAPRVALDRAPYPF